MRYVNFSGVLPSHCWYFNYQCIHIHKRHFTANRIRKLHLVQECKGEAGNLVLAAAVRLIEACVEELVLVSACLSPSLVQTCRYTVKSEGTEFQQVKCVKIV